MNALFTMLPTLRPENMSVTEPSRVYGYQVQIEKVRTWLNNQKLDLANHASDII